VRKITKKLQKIDVEQNEAKRIKLMSRDEDLSRSISPCSNSSSSTSSTSLDWVEIGLRLPNGRRIDARFPPERTPFQMRLKAVFVISQSEVKCLAKKGSQYPRDEFAKAADQAEERVCLIWSRIVRSDQENLINFQSRNFS